MVTLTVAGFEKRRGLWLLNRSFICASPRTGVQALPPLDALSTLEEQCNYNVAHGLPTLCARPLGGNVHTHRRLDEGRQWLNNYLATDPQDVKSRRLLEQMNAAGK